eukprot:TRINITY_DN3480_c0_g1_i1.p4 TRINITY_DN3480_c0_g1~~TRINITY_DN3480_c0_g1_i1.p4  ORF type:complete len:51 (+),score=16.20 TRINITY_DN3480_c0_g1_i1:174-326(+)
MAVRVAAATTGTATIESRLDDVDDEAFCCCFEASAFCCDFFLYACLFLSL